MKIPGSVKAEALRLARLTLKACITARGGKVSDYEPKVISKAAREYLVNHPELLEQAQLNISKALARNL